MISNLKITAFFIKKHIKSIDKVTSNRDPLLSRPKKGAGRVIIDQLPYENKLTTTVSDEDRSGEQDKKQRPEWQRC